MIQTLTPEQEALLDVYRDKWLTIGLATGPCDREAVAANAKLLYTKILGRDEPKVIFMPSPYSAWIATCAIAYMQAFVATAQSEIDSILSDIEEQVNERSGRVMNEILGLTFGMLAPSDDLRSDQVRDRLREACQEMDDVTTEIEENDQVGRQAGEEILPQVSAQTIEQVECSVFTSVLDLLETSVAAAVLERTIDQLREYTAGVASPAPYLAWSPVWAKTFNQVHEQVRSAVHSEFVDDWITSEVRAQRHMIEARVQWRMSHVHMMMAHIDSMIEQRLYEQISEQSAWDVGLQVAFGVIDSLDEYLFQQYTTRVIRRVREWLKAPCSAAVDHVEAQVRARIHELLDETSEQFIPLEQALCQAFERPQQVNGSARDRLYEMLGSIVDRVWGHVSSQLQEQVSEQASEWVKKLVWPYPYGHLDAGWMAWRDYMEQVLGIDLPDDVREQWHIYRDTSQAGLVWALDGFCIISERPDRIEMQDGRLHCDGAPAIEYSDGFSVWSLHGIRVSREIAETPACELDPHLAIDTDLSVDVRREVVRKIGAERVCEKLGAVKIDEATIMDQEGGVHPYELLELDLGLDRPARALKMHNPSLPGVHIEFVHEDCATIQHALMWREGVDDFHSLQREDYKPPRWIR